MPASRAAGAAGGAAAAVAAALVLLLPVLLPAAGRCYAAVGWGRLPGATAHGSRSIEPFERQTIDSQLAVGRERSFEIA